jgi:hypothetical protein
MSDRPRRGTGLLLEGIVVLVSILLAFFLEGWRADRELARELSQELSNVRVELERNRDAIAAELLALARLETAGLALGETLRASASPTVAVPDTLAFLSAQWHVTFSASLGAVDALISSGRLAQVENTELRLGLAGLSAAVEDALEEEIFARQVAVEQLIPLISESGDWSVVTDVARGYFGLDGSAGLEGLTPQERNQGRALPNASDLLVPNTPAVRNALARRTIWISAARAEFAQLDTHIADLVALIP